MNAQLSMFEPQGAELPLLSARHANKAQGLLRAAENMQARGLVGVASALAKLGHAALDDAFTCETALQFERLAGLSKVSE